ncbi:MAG: MBL fold metallo-hydrolase [Ruminococcaceae bacterium]|nr:MBL fold metallo-hydrolase [Oscillospiraceae bacterium]
MAELKICWIGQSGYILCDGKHEICIDPYLSDVVDRVAHRGRMVKAPILPEDLKSDVVVCTHNHLDHVDIDAIPLMKKEKMLFLAPLDAKETLLSCGVTKYHAFDEGATFELGDFSLEAVFADHTVPAVGVLVKHGGKTLYFTSDTEYNEKLEKMAERNIDLLFVCINGKLGNMTVDEAVKLTKIINPKVGVPTHYGMFESNTEDPKRYTSRVSASFEMEHGREYTISEVMSNV